METESSHTKSFAAAKEHALQAAAEARAASIEKARELARGVDQCVHRNPWPCIAGSAALGLLLGYILGRNRK